MESWRARVHALSSRLFGQIRLEEGEANRPRSLLLRRRLGSTWACSKAFLYGSYHFLKESLGKEIRKKRKAL